MRSELLEGATPGASGTVSETGWSNSTVFRKYLEEHFMKYVQGRDPSEPLVRLSMYALQPRLQTECLGIDDDEFSLMNFAFKLSYIFWNGPKHPTSNG
jgi:hypothetical protein